MNWYKKALKVCNYRPLNAPRRIDSQSLFDDVVNFHFAFDTLGAEESDLSSRINEYYWYDLKLLNIDQIKYVESTENAPYQINEGKIDKNKSLIEKNQSYPPIVVDILNDIIDGYHRVFALKELGCLNVWAYVPDPKSKVESDELV